VIFVRFFTLVKFKLQLFLSFCFINVILNYKRKKCKKCNLFTENLKLLPFLKVSQSCFLIATIIKVHKFIIVKTRKLLFYKVCGRLENRHKSTADRIVFWCPWGVFRRRRVSDAARVAAALAARPEHGAERRWCPCHGRQLQRTDRREWWRWTTRCSTGCSRVDSWYSFHCSTAGRRLSRPGWL